MRISFPLVSLWTPRILVQQSRFSSRGFSWALPAPNNEATAPPPSPPATPSPNQLLHTLRTTTNLEDGIGIFLQITTLKDNSLKDTRRSAASQLGRLLEADPKIVTPGTLRQLLSLAHFHRRNINASIRLQLIVFTIKEAVAHQCIYLLPAAVHLLINTTPNADDIHASLSAIASLDSRSQEINELIVEVLRYCHENSVPLLPATFDVLLSGTTISIQVAGQIERAMIRQEFHPTETHLSALMKSFVERGDVKGARRYLQAIRRLRLARRQEGEAIDVPLHPRRFATKYRRDGFSVPTRHNILFLKSFVKKNDILGYFDYLRGVGTAPRARVSGALRQRIDVTPDNGAWEALISRLGRNHEVDTRTLLGMLDRLETHRTEKYPLDISFYNEILARLVDRGAFDLAHDVWRRLKARYQDALGESDEAGARLSPNGRTYSIGISMFCGRREYVEAFWLVEKAHASKVNDRSVGREEKEFLGASTPLVNTLIKEVAQAGRSDAAYILWTQMASRYGALPDDRTLQALLNIGAFHSVGHEPEIKTDPLSFGEGFAARLADRVTDLMANRRRVERARLCGLMDEKVEFPNVMEKMLAVGPIPKEDAIWDGMVAWQRARLIFLEVILGNWPGLSLIRNPVSSEGLGAAKTLFVQHFQKRMDRSESPQWISPWPQEVTFPRSLQFSSDSATGPCRTLAQYTNPCIIPPPPQSPIHPQIIPADFTFRAYIRLLGEHSLVDQIPLTLAWMRALRVTPHHYTLATAMAYYRYGEESTSSVPLFERYGDEEQGKFGRLSKWIANWIGAEGVPTDNEIKLERERIIEKRRTIPLEHGKRRRRSHKHTLLLSHHTVPQ